VLFFAGIPYEHTSIALVGLYGVAFVGLSIVSGVRSVRFMAIAPVALFFLSNLWSFVPQSLTPAMESSGYAVPLLFGWVAMAACVLVSLVLAARKIGWGLPSVAMTFLVVAIGARVLHRLFAIVQARDPGHVLALLAPPHGGIETVAVDLCAACWIALALAPFSVPVIRSRALGMLGAVGSALCAARLMQGLGKINEAHGLAVTQLGLAWVLVILGIAAAARSGGRGLAWGGFVLAILQVFSCPGIIAGVGENTEGKILFVMAIAFGALGLTLTAFARDLPLRPLRIACGVLFACATLGSCFENVGAVLELNHIVRIGGDPSQWWSAEILTMPALKLGFVVWSAVLALMSDPQPDQTRSSTIASP
jgi:hypothetical protein